MEYIKRISKTVKLGSISAKVESDVVDGELLDTTVDIHIEPFCVNHKDLDKLLHDIDKLIEEVRI